MKAKKAEYDDLLESIYSEHCIKCDLCDEEMNEFNTDEYFFAERLFKLGWRIKKETTCCPKCAKRKFNPNILNLLKLIKIEEQKN